MRCTALGYPWKYMATHSKKAFEASIHSETQQHQSQLTKIIHAHKKLKQFEKSEKVLIDFTKY